jgi:hypothetical protein
VRVLHDGSMSAPSIALSRRFCGPSSSGNGGYTAGRLAGLLVTRDTADERAVTVTLRRPPPLDVALSVRHVVATGRVGSLELWYDDALIARAEPGDLTAEPVEPVSVEEAAAAGATYRGWENHPFPRCFVCGPDREPGDGMRLAPGIVDNGRTACVWVPDASLVTDEDPSVVAAAFGWAALDCPGGWTSDLDRRPLVLGRMTAVVSSPPRVDQPHVVVGRLLGEDGRKTFTATSLFDAGRLVGRAEHTWIAVDPATFDP